MSVLVNVKFTGNTDVFKASLTERAPEYEAWNAKAKEAGCLHHQFGTDNGMVLVVDEWVTMDAFQSFFADPDLQQFITEVGSDGTPPEIWAAEAIDSPDKF